MNFCSGRCHLELAQVPARVALALHLAGRSTPSGVTSCPRAREAGANTSRRPWACGHQSRPCGAPTQRGGLLKKQRTQARASEARDTLRTSRQQRKPTELRQTYLASVGREIQQLALIGSSSSLHSEACIALGASDGVIHSSISLEAVSLRAAANKCCLLDNPAQLLLCHCRRHSGEATTPNIV